MRRLSRSLCGRSSAWTNSVLSKPASAAAPGGSESTCSSAVTAGFPEPSAGPRSAPLRYSRGSTDTMAFARLGGNDGGSRCPALAAPVPAVRAALGGEYKRGGRGSGDFQ
uniref:Uncharacterized protein n=1 Tax=Naja naja TaxID=35670 RepID=A0A8C6XRC9_NAJNA